MRTSNYTFLHPKNYRYINPIKGLQGCGVGYRFSFNGQEKDDEVSGAGNTMTAEFWEYDSRLGRRWNVDPISYPWQSTYCVFNNNPIAYIDPYGLEGTTPQEEKPNSQSNNHKQGDLNPKNGATWDTKTGWVLPDFKVKGKRTPPTANNGNFFSNLWKKIDNFMHDDNWNTPKRSPIDKVELFGQVKFEVGKLQVNGKGGLKSKSETDMNLFAKGDISFIAMAPYKPKKWEFKAALKVSFDAEDIMVIQQKLPLGFIYFQININPLNFTWQSIELGVTPIKKAIAEIETPTGKVEILSAETPDKIKILNK